MPGTEGDFLFKKEDLARTKLKEDAGETIHFENEDYISFRSVEGAVLKLNEKKASLDLYLPPEYFKPQMVDVAFEKPYEAIYTKNNSAFFNYALLYTTEKSTLNATGEIGARRGDYFGLTNFNYIHGDEMNRFVRLFTSISRDDRKTLRTYILGDSNTVSGFLGSQSVLGGYTVQKNFFINPYFLRYPPVFLQGRLEYVSEMQVYVNNQLVKKIELSPGDFLLENIPADVGLGNTRVIIKDIFGNEHELQKDFFYSDRLLKTGLQEYSYSFGFVRKQIGEKSFDYNDPAIAAVHNFGYSENIKLGYSLEASDKVISLGPSVSVLVSRMGVIDAAFNLSYSEGSSGVGGFLGYSFRSGYFSSVFSVRAESSGFSNLGFDPDQDNPLLEMNTAVGLMRKTLGSIGVQYSIARMESGSNHAKYALSYSKALNSRFTFFLTASKLDGENGSKDEVLCGIHTYFGKNISGSASFVSRENGSGTLLNIEKNLPLGTGFGFRAQAELNGTENADAGIRYQNRFGIYEADYRKLEGKEYFDFSTSGGIGYLDKSLFVSRPITDSYAKVKVNDIENVRVYYFGNLVGRTDQKGEIIIPYFRSFQDNRIDIEKKDIPIEYSIPTLSQYVNPPYRSGSVLRFDLKKTQSFVGNLFVLREGSLLAAEFATLKINVDKGEIETPTGRGGEFYLENLPAGTFPAKIQLNERECRFDLEVPKSEDVMVTLGDVICKESI